jgi:hypothetical protein
MFMSTVVWADDFYSFGAPDCGYGRYSVGSECVEYGTLDADGMCNGPLIKGGACLNAFIKSSAEITGLYPFNSGYGDLGVATDFVSEIESACGSAGVSGGACLNAFVTSSSEVKEWYPFWGGFGDFGMASDIFEKMQENVCMDGYYTTNITDDVFQPMKNGECTTGTTSYTVANDCQYIDIASPDPDNVHSPLFFDNWMCGKLCDTDLIYTGTGACSSFCEVDDKVRRFHVRGGEYDFSVPLYVDKLTAPAMNLSIYDKSTGQRKMCYMNLLPRKGEQNIAIKYKETVLYSSK